jgi:drug/metabolite transporter (DMT)-like permease
MGYYELSVNGAEASLLSPLLGLYVIIPTLIGLIFLKERKTPLKLLGVLLGGISVLLLGFGAAFGADKWSLLTPSGGIYFSIAFLSYGISYFLRGIASKTGK